MLTSVSAAAKAAVSPGVKRLVKVIRPPWARSIETPSSAHLAMKASGVMSFFMLTLIATLVSLSTPQVPPWPGSRYIRHARPLPHLRADHQRAGRARHVPPEPGVRLHQADQVRAVYEQPPPGLRPLRPVHRPRPADQRADHGRDPRPRSLRRRPQGQPDGLGAPGPAGLPRPDLPVQGHELPDGLAALGDLDRRRGHVLRQGVPAAHQVVVPRVPDLLDHHRPAAGAQEVAALLLAVVDEDPVLPGHVVLVGDEGVVAEALAEPALEPVQLARGAAVVQAGRGAEEHLADLGQRRVHLLEPGVGLQRGPELVANRVDARPEVVRLDAEHPAHVVLARDPGLVDVDRVAAGRLEGRGHEGDAGAVEVEEEGVGHQNLVGPSWGGTGPSLWPAL